MTQTFSLLNISEFNFLNEKIFSKNLNGRFCSIQCEPAHKNEKNL